MLTGVVLYVAFVEKLEIGGGEEYSLWSTLLATFSLFAGGPERGESAIFAASLAVLLIVASLAAGFWRNRTRGMLFLTATFLGPAVVLSLSWNDVVYPRYFLVPMLFAYIALGCEGARWVQSAAVGRWGGSLLLTGFLACNLVPTAKLIAGGRGQYAAAVRWMAEHTTGPAVTVASDHDFRNLYMLQFYAGREHAVYEDRGKRLYYFDREKFPKQGTEWLLRHSFSGDPAPVPEFATPNGVHYTFQRVFPCESFSGWTWWLYRRR